jgi:hypothetical protein
MWKFEGIENDAAARAGGWNLRMRTSPDVDEIADERTQKDERKIAQRCKKSSTLSPRTKRKFMLPRR